MNGYKHIFFDLDQTLWDFETNSREALTELSDKYEFAAKGIKSMPRFLAEYFSINEKMWEYYRKGTIDKNTLRYARFELALKKFGINNKRLAEDIANDYMLIAPQKTNMFPHTMETLNYLKPRYTLHIITNGFQDSQHVKIRNCGIQHYFNQIITSERAGFRKPDIRIFQYSLSVANACAENSIMIGDSLEADIIGARDAEIHQVYFNPSGKPHTEKITYEIKSLNELITLL